MPGKVVKFVAAPSLALIVLVHAVAAQQRGRPPDASKDYPLPTTALPVEQQDEKPPVDRHGDPLPLHAVSRLGTLRFRGVNGVIQAVAVSGGKQLLGLGESPPAVILWDAVTGKEIRRFEGPVPACTQGDGCQIPQRQFRIVRCLSGWPNPGGSDS